MMKRIKARYNMGNKYRSRQRVKLPVSKTVVRMTMHDAGSVMQSLLMDSRIKDDEDNPLAPPPSKQTHIFSLPAARGLMILYWEGEIRVGPPNSPQKILFRNSKHSKPPKLHPNITRNNTLNTSTTTTDHDTNKHHYQVKTTNQTHAVDNKEGDNHLIMAQDALAS